MRFGCSEAELTPYPFAAITPSEKRLRHCHDVRSQNDTSVPAATVMIRPSAVSSTYTRQPRGVSGWAPAGVPAPDRRPAELTEPLNSISRCVLPVRRSHKRIVLSSPAESSVCRSPMKWHT